MSNFINVNKSSTSNAVLRQDVQMGDVFIKKGDKSSTAYAHTGTRSIPPSTSPLRYQSINLVTQDTASSAKGDAKVTIVGKWDMNVTIHDSFPEVAELLQ